MQFDRSRVTSVDWASYPMLTFPEAPAVEVALIDRPDQPPFGAGEAATAPVAAALANAIFDAPACRLRTVPFTAERVKAALARCGVAIVMRHAIGLLALSAILLITGAAASR